MNKRAQAASASQVSCVGIIMDGNRRFALSRGLPKLEGHTEGYKKLKEFVRWARAANIPHLVAYAFSTENWQRPDDEIGHLMNLLRSVLARETKEMVGERIRIRFVGDRSRFDKDLRDLMERAEAATDANYDLTLHLLMSYGGRAEIIAAAQAAAQDGTVTEETFSRHLWTTEMPDPDLIIRTGGQKRLSNFLPWQSIYSELFFTDTFWPDFSKEEFDAFLEEFAGRERRRGK